ncbi:MAG: CRISPR-associated endonuclease Cas3'' [Phycisphaerales bacterium]
MPTRFSHTFGPDTCDWEPIETHLEEVATLAANFASSFGAASLGGVLGFWHDLGKYSDEFQNYLRTSSGLERLNAHIETPDRVDHSTYGAQLAASKSDIGRLLSFCIAGHHGGMPDATSDDFGPSLEHRLDKRIPRPVGIPAEIADLPVPKFPKLQFAPRPADRSFQIAFFMRMLFSCLVDADFLATERFMNLSQSESRTACVAPHLQTLRTSLANWLAQFQSAPDNTVKRSRMSVLEACRDKASGEQGFYSLTVPTGGGKTLSSLAFALDHALKHDMCRVVYAIPYTSIIEQNAAVFRDALGEGAVLEHHSNFEPAREDTWSRLASENWDASLIVTTTVQLYESLFSNRPSKCRKLHNLARSVIILDEAQSIPIDLLRPTLAALQELVRNYGCTVVLCTATQPAITERPGFPIGLSGVTEIIDDERSLFAALRRTTIEHPRSLYSDELVEELAAIPAVLCIVSTKRESRSIFKQLRSHLDEDPDHATCFHLSTDMCPRHRADTLEVIRARLKDKLPCRVVSTNLIEAGVDIDFPVVYRAMAGLDSIAQAAGRCNREGELPQLGRVVLFELTDFAIPKLMLNLKKALEDAHRVLGSHDDPLSPDAIHAYFSEHYWKRSDDWDKHEVMDCFQTQAATALFQFRTAAERYRLIRTEQTPIVVPYGEEGRALIEEMLILSRPADRALRRRCQRFAVPVYSHVFQRLNADRRVSEPPSDLGRGIFMLTDPSAYDPNLGLDPDASGIDPDLLIEGGI